MLFSNEEYGCFLRVKSHNQCFFLFLICPLSGSAEFFDIKLSVHHVIVLEFVCSFSCPIAFTVYPNEFPSHNFYPLITVDFLSGHTVTFGYIQPLCLNHQYSPASLLQSIFLFVQFVTFPQFTSPFVTSVLLFCFVSHFPCVFFSFQPSFLSYLLSLQKSSF